MLKVCILIKLFWKKRRLYFLFWSDPVPDAIEHSDVKKINKKQVFKSQQFPLS